MLSLEVLWLRLVAESSLHVVSHLLIHHQAPWCQAYLGGASAIQIGSDQIPDTLCAAPAKWWKYSEPVAKKTAISNAPTQPNTCTLWTPGQIGSCNNLSEWFIPTSDATNQNFANVIIPGPTRPGGLPYWLQSSKCPSRGINLDISLTCRWCSSCKYRVLKLMSAAVNSRGSISGAMSGTGPNTEVPKECEGNPCCKLNRITTITTSS